jgi:hypothetical protein
MPKIDSITSSLPPSGPDPSRQAALKASAGAALQLNQSIEKGLSLYTGLMQHCQSLDENNQKQVNLDELQVAFKGQVQTASSALKDWYSQVGSALSSVKGSMPIHLPEALSGTVSTQDFKAFLGVHPFEDPSKGSIRLSLMGLSHAGREANGGVLQALGATKEGTAQEVANPNLEGLLQQSIENIQSLSTDALMVMCLTGWINNLQGLSDLLAQSAKGLQSYITACNNLVASMNAYAGQLMGDNAPAFIGNSEGGAIIYNKMIQLGIPNDQISQLGNQTNGYYNMNAANLQANISTVNNLEQVASQKSNQLSTTLSSVNQSLQEYLKYFQQYQQGKAQVVNLIVGNL